MDDSSSPPPIPDRPGRAVQIQSIDSLRSESTPNEYVDTNTITGAHQQAPQRPPKLYQSASLKSKAHIVKGIEQHENIRNELREHWQVHKLQSKSAPTNDSQSPEIPPRSGRPPPVPPRDSRVVSQDSTNDRLPSRPIKTHSSVEPSSTWKCNSTAKLRNHPPPTTTSTHVSDNKSPLPATVLIISEESSFPQFATSRSHRLDKVAKDSTSSRPVTQQPAASNVTLTLGEAGTVSNTIICPDCGQCRCSDCSGHRHLPERWLCEGNCRCSADSVVDALSCMWCVKSCFKTIIDNPDGSRIHPCACTESPKCLLRWTGLALFSLCLPCLCCYGPMQLGVRAATACYNCRTRGCNCDKD